MARRSSNDFARRLFRMGLLLAAMTPALPGADAPFSNLERYLLDSGHSESWPAAELERFRTFPRLDRAYRLARTEQWKEAQAEVLVLVEQYPDNLRVRTAYLTVLQGLGDHAETIRQAGAALERHPRFVPALVHRSQAYEAKGDLGGAIADLRTLAGLPELTAVDRRAVLDRLAELSLRTGDPGAALSALARLQPLRRDFRDEFRRGLALERRERPEEAEAAYRNSLGMARHEPERLEALRGIATAAAKARHWSTAREASLQALHADPRDAVLLAALGQAEYRLENHPEAIRRLRQALEIHASAPVRELLANLLLERRQWSAARVQFERLLAESPSRAQEAGAFRSLSQIAEAQGDFAGSVEWWKRSLEIDPAPGAPEHWANLLLKARRPAEAEQVLNELLRAPRDTAEKRRLLRTLGEARIEQRQFAAAARAFAEAAAGGDAAASEAAATAYEQAGDLASAIAWRERAIENAPSSDAFLRLARLHLRNGDSGDAIANFERAARSAAPPSKRIPVYRELGFAQLKSGDDARAADAFRSALALDPNNSGLHRTLGETLMRCGRFQDAAGEFKAAMDAGDPAAWRSLAIAQERAGSLGEAASTYEKALNGMTRPSPAASAVLKLLAGVASKRNRHGDAARRYLDAFDAGAGKEGALLASAGESLLLAKCPDEAVRVYQRYLARPDVAGPDRGRAFENLGLASIQLGNDEMAVSYLAQAIASGGNQRVTLGYALYRLGRWQPALEAFRDAIRAAPDARLLLVIGQCHRKLDQPGPAVDAFTHALQDGGLKENERLQAQIELGYLYSEQRNYSGAAETWRMARQLGAGPEIAFRLARAERLSGDSAAAQAQLAEIEPGSLPSALGAEYFDEAAQLHAAAGRYDESLAAWEAANRIEPSPRRSYEIGLNHYKLRDPAKAIPYLEAAAASESNNTVYLRTLAQSYQAAGRLEEAATRLRMIVAAGTEDSGIDRELAYLEMRRSQSSSAAFWFRKAIDSAADRGAQPSCSGECSSALREDLSRLSKRFYTTMYYGYSDDRVALGPAAGLNASTVMPAGSGVEFAFQPPVAGFRNERTLQVFARAVWNAKPGSLAPEGGSRQGGIGFRYKPLVSGNLQLSMESLIPLAAGARHNWLARVMYSWGTAIPRDAARTRWSYRELFLDAPFLLAGERFAVQYGQFRQGVTFKLGDAFLVTPLVVAIARHQAPLSATGTYWEAGPGVSLRFLYHETEYSPRTSSVELLVDCHHGNLLGRPGTPGFHGCSATAISRF